MEETLRALWGNKVSSAISRVKQRHMSTLKIGGQILCKGGHYPTVYVDGIYLRLRNWGLNVAILVAIAVNEDRMPGGFRCC